MDGTAISSWLNSLDVPKRDNCKHKDPEHFILVQIKAKLSYITTSQPRQIDPRYYAGEGNRYDIATVV